MIKLIVLDIDGCMTNGQITYDVNGVETKSFNVKDGLGIVTWLKIGGEAVIITGRKSTIVANRAKELGIPHLFQGIKEKGKVLQELMDKLNITKEEVAVIGDDLNDLPMFALAETTFTPADGMEIIKKHATYTLSKKGGEGAIREMIDIIITKNNQTKQFESFWI